MQKKPLNFIQTNMKNNCKKRFQFLTWTSWVRERFTNVLRRKWRHHCHHCQFFLIRHYKQIWNNEKKTITCHASNCYSFIHEFQIILGWFNVTNKLSNDCITFVFVFMEKGQLAIDNFFKDLRSCFIFLWCETCPLGYPRIISIIFCFLILVVRTVFQLFRRGNKGKKYFGRLIQFYQN